MHRLAPPGLSVALLLLLLFLFSSGPAAPQSQARELSPVGATLDLDGRLACQRAVEEVFWQHRIWPAENPTPKPSLDAVLPAGVLRARAEEGARKSNALDTLAGQSITGEMLQREMERMARETRQPEVLRELWAALDNDPTLIAECVARPALADRLLTAWHAHDERASAEPFAAWWVQNGVSHVAELVLPTFDYELPEIAASREARGDGAWVPTPAMPERTNGSSVWTGTEMIIWGGGSNTTGRSNEGSRYNPATDSWYPTSTPFAPEGRYDHSAVWTGTEMIVWGGCGSASFSFCERDTGGRYDPLTDSWIEVTRTNAADARIRHTAVWTGSEMIVWGGCAPQSSQAICAEMNTGGRYDPATDSWSPTTLAGAPSERVYHTAVWDGEEMIVWGGEEPTDTTTDTGGRYDPATDSWTATSSAGAPEPRRSHTAVWTGSEMIVWGGCGVIQGCLVQGTALGTGARYDPATDSWSAVTTTSAPSPRVGHAAVWTGTEMIVWGGGTSNNLYYRSGGRYDPATDSWTPTSTSGAPTARAYHQYAWTGSELIVWGGSDRTGGRYNPQTDSWSPTSTEDPDSRRYRHTAVWTGSEMIVWGGDETPTGTARSGRLYNPTLRTWRETSMVNVPWQRESHSAIWTGTEMIVWGGRAGSTGFNDGGRYNPTSDSWTPTSTANAPEKRGWHTAVWTGSEMIVWGGTWNSRLNTGGRYNPSTDTWTATSTVGAPLGREWHTAVWTGGEMIVWGGLTAPGEITNTGGRYTPSTNSWTATATTGAPSARLFQTGVWTGSEMIIWGGTNDPTTIYYGMLNSGGRYDPMSDSWTATSVEGAPSPRIRHTAVWTGAEMIVGGGNMAEWPRYFSGGHYDPASDSWVPLPVTGAPARREWHSVVWTGSMMIVWGGTDNTTTRSGAEYYVTDAPPPPITPTPTATSLPSTPTATSVPSTPTATGVPATPTATTPPGSGGQLYLPLILR